MTKPNKNLKIILLVYLSLSALLLNHVCDGSASSYTSSSMVISSTATSAVAKTEEGKKNVVFQVVGYFKDSATQFCGSCGEMWGNHKECGVIRSKKKEHRNTLKMQWETENVMTKDEINQKLKTVNGGITYEDFRFLKKGVEDRGKLFSLLFVFQMAPRYLPYVFMFNPGSLPSPFQKNVKNDNRGSIAAKLSRDRSHAVIETLINIERNAWTLPFTAKMNIFGKKKQQRALILMDKIGNDMSKQMTTPEVRGSVGAQIVLDSMESVIYDTKEYNRKELRLVNFPKTIVSGLSGVVNGQNPLTKLVPFIQRNSIISHIQTVEQSDQFLVSQGVDISSLSTTHLEEACNERCIGGLNRSDDEMIKGLANWLDLAVVRPATRIQQSGEFFNGNAARFALLGYNALEATKDPRAVSFVPRSLFQG